MSTTPADPNGPSTDREFDSQLSELIRTAHENGVDVEGGWAVRPIQADDPDWGVEIYEVRKHQSS